MLKSDHEKCIEYSTKALEAIDRFQNETKSFSKQNVLEIKIRLRRARTYQTTNEFEKAKSDLDKILLLDHQNAEAGQLLKQVQGKLDDVTFGVYKDKGNELLKKKQFVAALEQYDQALRVTRKATSLDNISVYVNRIACLLSLDKLDRVISECNEAIRLIRNYRNRFNVKGPDLERLNQMDLRVAVRRGNALGKLQRISEAIAEYERALKIDPSNNAVKKDLDLLRKAK